MKVTNYRIGKADENSAFSIYRRQYLEKLESGIYQMEYVKCFCGSDDYIPITAKDRYLFDYRLVLCKHCGLLYANPRLTEDSFKEFYREEYRHIYDREIETQDHCFESAAKFGTKLIEQLDWFEIRPKTVFEIGCNTGGFLSVFKDRGCDVLGVDYDENSIQYGRQKGLDVRYGGIELLEKTGVKADLIVMSDMIEHLLHLEDDLLRIQNLMAPNGILFIYTPGMNVNPAMLRVQNAHTFQFSASSLQYVMECCGFMELYIDDEILSIWTVSAAKRDKSMVDQDEVRYVNNYFFGTTRMAPKVRSSCKFSIPQRKANVKYALESGIPDIAPLEMIHRGKEALIIGGGPTIDGQMEKISEKVKEGAIVVAIERMYSWCMDHGITPDYVVVLDASDDVMESFHSINENTTHLIAAQVNPTIIDKLKSHNSYVFSVHQPGVPLAKYFEEGNKDVMTLINSGSSVTLCAMSVAMYLGCSTFNVFGFDCHTTDGNYAKGITGVGEIKDVMEVEINGRRFKTTAPFLSFAQQFFQMWQMAKGQGVIDRVRIYGDSLVSAMSREDIRG